MNITDDNNTTAATAIHIVNARSTRAAYFTGYSIHCTDRKSVLGRNQLRQKEKRRNSCNYSFHLKMIFIVVGLLRGRTTFLFPFV
jgi:hypothetical protein